ncbi:MAG: ATP-binding cassette domain-containing protein [Mycoplasma sp.]
MGKYANKIKKLQEQDLLLKQTLIGHEDNYKDAKHALASLKVTDRKSYLQYKQDLNKASKLTKELDQAKAIYLKNKYVLTYYELLDQYPNKDKANPLMKYVKWIESNKQPILPYNLILLIRLNRYHRYLKRKQLRLAYLQDVVLTKKLKEQKQTWSLKLQISYYEKKIKDLEAKIANLNESFSNKFHAKFVSKLEKAKKDLDTKANKKVAKKKQKDAKQKSLETIELANKQLIEAKNNFNQTLNTLKQKLANKEINQHDFNDQKIKALDQLAEIKFDVKTKKKNAKYFYKNYSDFSELENVIELKNVCKYYNNGFLAVKVLQDVNLKIKKGEFVVILGPSGSGKTTLLNIISGMDNATYGDVFIAGENLIDYNQSQLTKFRKNNIGYVFQQYCLLPNLTVKENIQIGQNLQPNKSLHINIESILDTIGMSLQKNKYPNELSGGQQQRVSIARSVAKNPNILFGDEPTGAIDEEMSKEIMKLLVKINQEYKTTIIIVTHNPLLAQLATTVVHVGNGTIQKITHHQPKTVDELNWNKGL